MINKILAMVDKLIDRLRTLPILGKIPVNFYRFAVVGSSGFIVDFIIFNILYHIFFIRGAIPIVQITPEFTFSISIANILAVAVGSIYGFLLNKTWSFSNKSKKFAKQYSQYLLVAIINNLVNNLIFGTLMFGVFTADQRTQFLFTTPAKVLATSFQVFTSYALYKLVVFKPEKE